VSLATAEEEMTRQVGVQIAPWTSAREVQDVTSLLAKAFTMVWVPDQLLARNAYVLLAALAASGRIGVASGVAVPLGRNPMDLASAMATISELLPAEQPIVMGMGAGGPLVSRLFSRREVTDLLRESIQLIRRLWAGETVRIDAYPRIHRQLRWRSGATARLAYPVERSIPIVVAVGGPRTLQLVEDEADGLLCTSTYPPLSCAALDAAATADVPAMETIMAMAARREQAGRPLRLMYGLSCCVSADRQAARAFARRQVALVVGNPAMQSQLGQAGLDPEMVADVRCAFQRGGGVEEAGLRLPDAVVDAFVVAGTAEECAERLAGLVATARRVGFTELYLGAPLGPCLSEAARLLVDTVVPRLWPAS
jgi:5,10-methylenetetrahydromethanopterin reductase